MKKIRTILCLLLLTGMLAACGNDSESESHYNQLTSWDFHPSYRFLLSSVEEQGSHALLRGAIVTDTLTPDEVAAARAAGSIEINGDTFTHTAVNPEGFMPNDRLRNARTGEELYLVVAFFGDFEGDDPRYRITTGDWSRPFHHFFKNTGMYYEVEVPHSTPIEVYRLTTELMEWGYLEMFAPLHVTARAFTAPNPYELPPSFPFGGSFDIMFENQVPSLLRWLP